MATETRQESHTIHAWRAADDQPVWESARDELVRAVDGRTLLDLSMEHGAALWGHGSLLERIMRRYSPQELATGLGGTQTTVLRERATDELVGWAREQWQNQPELVAGILHTGAEAVEAAVKTAIAATGKPGVVAFEHAYHGSFGVAAGMTASASGRSTFDDTVEFEHVRRERYGSVPVLDESVACVIAEPIQGPSGVTVPDDDWLDRLRSECSRVGALLVVDAVLVGAGRTGRAIDGAEAGPDIVTMAKAIGGGVVCSAVIARREVAEAAWEGDGAPSLSTTYYGHPLACAAILEVLELHETHDVPGLADRVAVVIQDAAREAGLAASGRGAFWGLSTGRADGGGELASALLDRGVIVTTTGVDGEAVTLTPSIRMSDDSLDWMREAIIAAGEALHS